MKRTVLALAVFLVVLPRAAFAAVASQATDICPADADPCIVQQFYDVVSGSVLDFGTRTVEVAGSGQIDANNGDVTVLSGDFIVDPGPAPGIKVRGLNGFGVTDGGTFTLEARRRCELGTDRTCLSDTDCSLGVCDVSVCSGDHDTTCASDAACDLGECAGDNTCTLSPSHSCVTANDCKLGTCSIDVCSGNRATTCSTDGDCNLGACSVGDGSVQIQSPVRADGGQGGGIAGAVLIRAAGDVSLASDITANSNSVDSDGGIIDIESGQGNVTVASLLSATGGGAATGGEIDIAAGQDAAVNGILDVSGGDFDGGYVEIDAVRDIALNQAVRAGSVNAGGFGGEVTVSAGRDILATSPGGVVADGHYSAIDNFGGDGGSIGFSAGRDLVVNGGVSVSATGAIPDGFGGEILTESGRDTTVAGMFVARTSTSAPQGAGGDVELTVAGKFAFPTGALLDVRGAQNGGGVIYVETQGPMTFGGTMDARTTNNGRGDGISLDIGGDVTMTGSMRISGYATNGINGEVDFQFCRLTMSSGAVIENAGSYGRNKLSARERMTIQQGASITADGTTGLNRLIYRDEAKPPVVNGTVSPAAAANDTDPFLPGCPVCGNGELDGGETCEDGNIVSGDGCSAQCQDEACISQTPGYPAVALCDDGNGCTQDICTSHTCEHVSSCDDGIDCTVDSCNAQLQCEHVVDDGFCADGNPCTNDICSLGQRGCVLVDNTNLCDDGLTCTEGDRCEGGVCTGTDTCSVPGETCQANTNMCAPGGVCGDAIVDGTETCDDGDTAWLAGQSCSADCQLVMCGDPDNTATVRASDALFILRVAVGVSQCDACVCNVDNNTSGAPVTASDALRVLRASVGVSVELSCPTC